jgi:hypothetical protein
LPAFEAWPWLPLARGVLAWPLLALAPLLGALAVARAPTSALLETLGFDSAVVTPASWPVLKFHQ